MFSIGLTVASLVWACFAPPPSKRRNDETISTIEWGLASTSAEGGARASACLNLSRSSSEASARLDSVVAGLVRVAVAAMALPSLWEIHDKLGGFAMAAVKILVRRGKGDSKRRRGAIEPRIALMFFVLVFGEPR